MALDTIKFASFISMLTSMFGQTMSNDMVTDIGAKIILMMEDSQGQKVDLKFLFTCIYSYHKIDAIREYRRITGEGLKESKDAIESIINRMSAPSAAKIVNEVSEKS